MAHPRISAQLPPDIDPTKAPVAFGRRGLPKLNEELQHPELLTRQRALMALCDLVHDPENAYQAIGLGFLENLKKLLLDEDKTVRQKTTEVLYIMATHSIGRTNFVEHGVIPALAQLLNDPVDICRWNMHYALKLLSETPTGNVSHRGHMTMGCYNLITRWALGTRIADPRVAAVTRTPSTIQTSYLLSAVKTLNSC